MTSNVYELGILSMKPCLAVVMRSLLAHHYDLFFGAYKGDYAELFPEKVIDNEGKLSCILPVTGAIAKHDASGKLITITNETFACASHVHLFGKHMPVDPTGIQFSAVYGHHKLAKHTVLAGLQFDPGSYLPGGFVFDPGGFTRLLRSLQAVCDVMINNAEQHMEYYLRNVSNVWIVGTSSCPGQCHFRQKGSDKNHTGLSPHRLSEICSFVFTSHQV